MRISKEHHLKRLLATQDVCFSVLCYAVAVDVAFWLGHLNWRDTSTLLQLLPIPFLLGTFASLRSLPTFRNQTLRSQFWFAVQHTFIVVGGVLFFLYVIDIPFDPEPAMFGFAAMLGFGLLGNRVFLKWWYLTRRRENRANHLKVLMVGAGPRAQRLMSRYRASEQWGLDIVGILDPDPELWGTQVGGVLVLGGLDKIDDVMSHRVIDEVLVCMPRRLIDDADRIARICDEEGVVLKFVADVYDFKGSTVRLEEIDDVPVLSFEPVSHGEGVLVAKRIIDLLLVMVALPLLLPLFLIVALAIKLDSKGPVFFVQERVGLHKRRFNMIKFRSMYQDAEERMKEIEHLNEADGPIFKIQHDPRVTRVGRFIRRTSIDELPQLFNVFMGHVSLVGPRPMSVRDVSRFDRSVQRKRFSVRPGLICLREVSGRSRLSFDRWLELDLQYIDEWSLWMDVKILLKAIPSVLKGDGAH